MSLSIRQADIQHFRARVSTTDTGQDPLPLVQLLVLDPVKSMRSPQMHMDDICCSAFCVWPDKVQNCPRSAILKRDLIIEADGTHAVTC